MENPKFWQDCGMHAAALNPITDAELAVPLSELFEQAVIRYMASDDFADTSSGYREKAAWTFLQGQQMFRTLQAVERIKNGPDAVNSLYFEHEPGQFFR